MYRYKRVDLLFALEPRLPLDISFFFTPIDSVSPTRT